RLEREGGGTIPSRAISEVEIGSLPVSNLGVLEPEPARRPSALEERVEDLDRDRVVARARARVDASRDGGSRRRDLLERGVERADELQATDLAQELLETRDGRLVVRADGEDEPLARDLGISGRREREGSVERGEPFGIGRTRKTAKEVEPVEGRPLRSIEIVGARALRDALERAVEDGEPAGLGPRDVLGKPRFVDPRLGIEPALEVRIVREDLPAKIGEKALGRHALEREAIEISPEEAVPSRAPDHLLAGAKEEVALLVGDGRHAVVGIAAGERKDEARIGGRQALEIGEKLVIANPREHLVEILAVELLHDPVLEIDGESFVQPEVAPRRVGDEIARPGVRELVGDERDEGTIAGKDRRRRERQPRILHAAPRKARWKDEDVVALPAIRAVEILGCGDHLLG